MLRYILPLTVTIFAFSSIASAQNTQSNKITLKEREIIGEVPYQINDIVINGEPVEMNSSFSVGSTGNEWEKTLTFNFVNTSRKDITYLHITLMIPSPDDSKLRVAAPFFWFRGKTAGSVLPMFRGDNNLQEMFRDVPDLRPGETLQIKLQEKYYDAFLKVIGILGLSTSGDVKDVSIWVYTIGFSDGTIWGYGKYFKPDPNDPIKYDPIEKVSALHVDRTQSGPDPAHRAH